MRTAAMTLCFALLATAGATAHASGSCREYTLYDNDTEERVDGCVPLQVDATNTKPVQVVPAMKKRARFGWKIAELSRGDLLARLGLRPGDVILSLNGYDLGAQDTPNIIADILGRDDKLIISVGKKPRARMDKAKGTTMMEVTKNNKGIKLDKIPAGSFFETIGLEPGDVVLSIGGHKVKSPGVLAGLAEDAEKMPEVHVIILRNGQEMDLLVKTE